MIYNDPLNFAPDLWFSSIFGFGEGMLRSECCLQLVDLLSAQLTQLISVNVFILIWQRTWAGDYWFSSRQRHVADMESAIRPIFNLRHVFIHSVVLAVADKASRPAINAMLPVMPVHQLVIITYDKLFIQLWCCICDNWIDLWRTHYKVSHLICQLTSATRSLLHFVTLSPWLLTFWPNIHWWWGIVMEYPCAKFGDYTFRRFGFIVRTNKQKSTHTSVIVFQLRWPLWRWL